MLNILPPIITANTYPISEASTNMLWLFLAFFIMTEITDWIDKRWP